MIRIAALIATLAGPAGAQGVIDGNWLYDSCTASLDSNPEKFAWCIGYIVGTNEGMVSGAMAAYLMAEAQFSDAGEFNQAINVTLGRCLPENSTAAQMVDVVIKHLTENPAIRHEPARALLLLSLQEAFPCE